jgi:hypothetical protein
VAWSVDNGGIIYGYETTPTWTGRQNSSIPLAVRLLTRSRKRTSTPPHQPPPPPPHHLRPFPTIRPFIHSGIESMRLVLYNEPINTFSLNASRHSSNIFNNNNNNKIPTRTVVTTPTTDNNPNYSKRSLPNGHVSKRARHSLKSCKDVHPVLLSLPTLGVPCARITLNCHPLSWWVSKNLP